MSSDDTVSVVVAIGLAEPIWSSVSSWGGPSGSPAEPVAAKANGEKATSKATDSPTINPPHNGLMNTILRKINISNGPARVRQTFYAQILASDAPGQRST